MMKKNHVAVAVTLALGAAGVEAATTNSASTVPSVLIGGTNVVLGNVTLVEGGAGQLSATSPQNTFYIQLPTGVSFNTGATVSADPSDGTMNLGAGAGAAQNATLSDTDGDSKNDRATWTISAASGAGSNSIAISGINVDVASTVAAGDIALSVSSNTPGNPGLTSGSVTNGRAVAAGTTNELTTTAPNVLIGGSSQTGGTLLITESATGTLASSKTVTVTLPTGVTFGGTPNGTPTNMNLGAGANTAQAGSLSSDNRTATWTVTTASTGSSIGQISIPLSNLTIGSTVAAGAINATVGGTASVTAGTVAVATAATGSTTTSAVNTTLGQSPAGRNAVAVSDIKIVENFGEVVSDAGSSTITLTLPTGVTFSSQPTIASTNGGGSDAATTTGVSSAVGFNTATITIAAPTNPTDAVATTYSIAGMSVNIGSSVAAGDLAVAIAGSTGSGVAAASANVLTVVDSSVTVTANATIPTRGIGGSGQGIGEFTVVENVAGALLANSSTITLALPAGVTWNAAPTVSATGSMGLGTVTLSSDKQTATVPVATASTSASTITVSGNVDIASTVAAGDIAVTIGGTAGASGSATVATAAQGTSTAVSSITSLTAGTPTQSIGTVTVTESFAGALAASGQFRMVLPSGLTWATSDPTITTTLTGSSGTKLVNTASSTTYNGTVDSAAANWDFERATTFTSNDTLIIRAPNTASTGATAVALAGLKVNVASNAADGNVQVSIVDGDLSAANGAGVIGSTETVAVVGTALALSADNTDVSVATGSTGTVTLSGGVGDSSISTQPDSTVATASLVNGVLTITPVAAGTTTIVVSDSASTPSTVTINVAVTTVAAPIDLGTPGTLTGAATNAAIAGGVSNDSGATQATSGTFAATDSLDVIGSITVDPAHVGQDGSILVLAGLDQGSGISWFMKDSSGAWQAWDGVPANLVANDGPRALTATESISVATGLTGLTGNFSVFVGYEIGDEIVYNGTPITFTVE